MPLNCPKTAPFGSVENAQNSPQTGQCPKNAQKTTPSLTPTQMCPKKAPPLTKKNFKILHLKNNFHYCDILFYIIL